MKQHQASRVQHPAQQGRSNAGNMARETEGLQNGIKRLRGNYADDRF